MKYLTAFFLTCLLITPALAQEIEPLKTKARQAIVIDHTTGQILFAKNADTKMPTSSMSKTMTVYAMFDALKNEDLSLTDTFKVSKKAWKKGGSKMFVEIGKQVKIEDLIRGIIVQSGNDATIVVAEGLAESELNFAEDITDMAYELGMKNTNFTNASGWPDPEHYSTAKDLATLAAATIDNFPEYYHYFSEQEFTYNEIKQRNRNPLIYQNNGADGLKTGHTEDGGYGLIGSGKHKGRRVIIVVNGLASEKDRAQESGKLLEWGLRNFTLKTIAEENEILGEALIRFGKEKTVKATVAEPLTLSVPKTLETPSTEITFTPQLTAPINKGDAIGTITISLPQQEPIIKSLIAANDIAQKNIALKLIDQSVEFVKGFTQ